jgi:hypothetical protein
MYVEVLLDPPEQPAFVYKEIVGFWPANHMSEHTRLPVGGTRQLPAARPSFSPHFRAYTYGKIGKAIVRGCGYLWDRRQRKAFRYEPMIDLKVLFFPFE